MAAKPAAPAPAPATPVASPGATLANAKEAIAAERTTQAEAALRSGDSARAAGLFRDAIAEAPNRPEIWKGLIQALHESGRNEQAVEQWAQVPDVPRAVLERDASFQLAVGGVLLAADRPDEALRAFVRAQDVFASQRLLPPLELVLRVATLLAARGDDGNLYRELMYLGERSDLNDAQRRNVQMIWTSWAVRRGRALAAAGDGRRAVTILNAAAEAFSGNPEVVAAVAEGYAGAGLPREAVALLKARDLSTAPARELQTAISAGIAAREYRAAEGWARLGKQRFPKDPEMLTAIAELEQARGHQGRAEELSQQAKALALPQDPAQVLTAELREAKAGIGVRSAPGGQLAVLLAPSEATTLSAPSQAGRPFLPASGPGTGKAAEVAPVLSGYEPLQREPGSL